MDPNAILSKLNKAAPGMILEKQRFGRSDALSVWVDIRGLRPIADAVSRDPGLGLDWVENLSVAQIAEALVLTYFLRGTKSSATLILRASIVPKSAEERVDVPSTRDVWPTIAQLENEASELFGIRFLDPQGEPTEISSRILPENWSGFPLRKSKEGKA